NLDTKSKQNKKKKTKNTEIKNKKKYEIQKQEIKEGGIKNIIPLMKYNKVLYNWLKDNKEQYDAIHAVDYDVGSIALKIKKKYDKKLIYHIADFYAESRLNIPERLKNYLRKKEYSVINQADATIICSEERKEKIKGSQPNNLIIVHNTPAIEQEEHKINPIIDNKIIKISYVGGLEKKRFIDKVIPVIKELPNYRLTLAGPIG